MKRSFCDDTADFSILNDDIIGTIIFDNHIKNSYLISKRFNSIYQASSYWNLLFNNTEIDKNILDYIHLLKLKNCYNKYKFYIMLHKLSFYLNTNILKTATVSVLNFHQYDYQILLYQ